MVIPVKVVWHKCCKDCGDRMAVRGLSDTGSIMMACVSCGCTTAKGGC